MSRGNHKRLTILFVLSVSFIVASLIILLLIWHYSSLHFQVLGNFCGEILKRNPECKQSILEILKADKIYSASSADENILLSFGYRQSDFRGINGHTFLLAGAGFLIGVSLFLFTFRYWN